MNQDLEFNFFKKKLLEKYGFDLSLYNQNYVERRIKARMMFYNIDSYYKYWEILENSHKEYENFLNTFAINVTEFFRDQTLWEWILNDSFVEIRKKLENKFSFLKIWSAGCSSGEEPYSIGILIYEKFFDIIKSNKLIVKITATDIDEDALKKAEEGLYKKESLKTLLNWRKDFLEKYFTLEKIGSQDFYRIKENIKKLVVFKKHNLLTEPIDDKFDVVFCRNLFIYFTKESKDIVVKKFYDSLVEGGLLVIGKSEVLFSQYFEPVNLQERVYRKIVNPATCGIVNS